jgi:predicted kinase
VDATDHVTALISLPRGAMVVLIGASGAGKTTFAARHFAPSQVLSSDHMRLLVADDPSDQAATDAAFEALHVLLSLRLAARRLSVVDATNLERWARERLLAIARRHDRAAIAVVLDTPPEVCAARNRLLRPQRQVPVSVVRRHHQRLRRTLDGIADEGFVAIHTVDGAAQPGDVVVERHPMDALPVAEGPA